MMIKMKDKFHSADCALRYNGIKCTCDYVSTKTDKQQIAELVTRVAELELVVKLAAAINYGVNNKKRLWHLDSPFQARIEEYVGKPPYGGE
jgi:hypothetical protein